MIYCFDIDGTICETAGEDYATALPDIDVVQEINRLYSEGNRILLYTARGTMTGIDWREITEKQLKQWNVKYHCLHLGKPAADVYIDDKAINVSDWKDLDFKVNMQPTVKFTPSDLNRK